ncbi:MAG: molybdenum cofactor synthesis domain-containing protein [Geodermatophilaceae bacterium]
MADFSADDGAHDDHGQQSAMAPAETPARAHVITASNRASAGVYEDRSGQLLAAGLAELGLTVSGPEVLPDDVATLTAALRVAVDSGAEVIVTTGGTGLSPTDVTPEATAPVLDRDVPGLAEALRRYGQDQTPYAVISRGLVGLSGRSLVVNLPGSTGGVRDGLAVLGPLLGHIVSQLRGGDHQQ